MKNLFLFTLLTLIIFSCKDDNDGGGIPAGAPILGSIGYDVTEAEEDKSFTIKFGFTEPVDKDYVLSYVLLGETAIADTDFAKQSGTVNFVAGDQQKEIEITILGDFIEEQEEEFNIRLFSTTSQFAEAFINVTIIDNDNALDNLVIPGGSTSPESYEGYTLVWEDEFTGTSLNGSDWNFEIGDGCPDLCGWGNNELQSYAEDNVSFMDDDYLIIQARPEDIGSSEYTSSRITTQGKQKFQYGRVDVRAVLPEGQGIWPAIWMLGEDITTDGWPACGEIDIMELIGSAPSTTHATFHFGRDFGNHRFKGEGLTLPDGNKFSEQFHIFSMIWEEDMVQILMDNQLVYEIDPSVTNPEPYPFNDEFFFIMNIAVGGNWPGNPNNSTVFPQHMIVDYIRVFQK